ncbi:hypothetical protein [Roseomonas chloroacetimidivorans]|uniref:hypothetical protein n=1 Tax=Roseomonas chloroacetimidivorans TaxID=1766656 RepID=UPI003C77A367
MDTHIEQTLPRPFVRPEMTLPGEEEDVPPTLRAEPADRLGSGAEEKPANGGEATEAGDTPPETESVAAETAQPAKRMSKRRNALMTGAAIAVVLVAAGGMFVISPYDHLAWLGGQAGPSGPLASGQTITLPAPVAPAASLARAPSPQPVANAPRTQPEPQPKPEALQEIVGLRSGDGPRPAPAEEAHPPTPVSPPAAEPASAPPPSPAAPATPVQASLAAPPPAQAAPPTPAAAPRDPVQRVVALQASPMSTPQQVEVLSLVTELGVLVRNQRAENAQLRADVQQMRERLDTQLGDYDRRLALAEARGAINAAMGAGASPPAAPAPTPATSPVTPVSVTVTAPAPHAGTPAARGTRPVTGAAPAPAPQDAAPKRYRVQAASPGLAMLAEVDRTGDAGNLLQVSVGDDVPGYGRVKSIAQQGTAWVLTAERGTIR